MAHLFGAESLHLEYPSGVVFENATLGIADKDRIGIVGRNGDGKSTLLALLAGRVTPDAGKVTSRRNLTMGYLDQADTLGNAGTVKDAVVGHADEHEWAGDVSARDVIDGLLSDIDLHADVSALSGGQRRRVSLAALLVRDDDVMFLDEPTNHLDIDAITWLADHLKKRATTTGAYVIVTHDRWFLDETCTTTWEVHDGIVEPFDGGYAAYVLQKVERDRIAAATEAKRQNVMSKELAWLRRGPPARTSKPRFRIEAANELIANEPPARNTVELAKLAMSRLGNDVIDLLDVSVSYGDTQVLRDIEWRIAPGERTGILGPNGAGKSTLLKLITGELQPTSGRIKRGKTVSVATLTQHSHALENTRGERVRDIVAQKKASYTAEGKEVSTSQLMERLGFTSPMLSARIDELSGGQKRRFQLMLILLDEPNVLVMDEPSNDLDTEMLAAMEDVLDTWAGTLIVVSHDRYLVERVTDNQYALMDGNMVHMPGGVEQYVSRSRTASHFDAGNSSRSTPRKTQIADRYAAQKELASVDRKLAKLPSQIAQANERIAAHEQSDYSGLAELAEALNALKAKQHDLENRWLELSDTLD